MSIVMQFLPKNFKPNKIIYDKETKFRQSFIDNFFKKSTKKDNSKAVSCSDVGLKLR